MKYTISYWSISNWICAILLFLAVLNFPIGYYYILRYIVCIGALLVVLHPKTSWYWRTVFLGIAILFNPLLPIFLYVKSYWIPLDIVCGILFLLVSFFSFKEEEKEKTQKTVQKQRNKNMYNIKY